ncbi:gliding motility-associated C-terminal domain-containing protein [Fluviicola sp.]|jgi:gliding motility-associated-like protein|uniref:gliding motility-associated C-terminal domain-containing protein n=1 Tax=Fluviicola sp. TaxID=1917219 RepID=UPI00281C10AC|nr:gliding motility-associated C-terminal domain-containing protein [Fluviicola sp.]MDR0801714.1 gliding motility-associated C-terminal domain-containing protein [Fluviicola sp.]
MVSRYLFLLIITAFTFMTRAQDVWLQNYFSPVSGCGLSNAETVNVLVNNNSAVVMPSNTITVSYTVDGGSLTDQPLSSNLTPGASWNFSFSVKANLSVCGAHIVKVWVSRPGDLDHLNDTVQWTVQNDCQIVPGTVTSNITVCQGANAGILSLSGWLYGAITSWESSADGGTTWIPIANTAPSYAYSNVSQDTRYHVQIDGGFCPDATSGYATITTQALPVAGTITGGDSLCENEASGALNLTGNTSVPVQWEYSANNGGTWTTVTNTTTIYNYVSLTTSTLYRVLVDGGVCSDLYSDTALIYVDPVYPQPVLTGSDSLCITSASGVVSATGTFGSVLGWESSADNGASWNAISNTTGAQDYVNLTQTTLYRMITKGGQCPDVVSDTAIIYVQGLPVPPSLGASDTLCANAVTGILNLAGAGTPVLSWESSTDDGNSWNPVSNTTTFYDYSAQTETTLYRVSMEGIFCPDYYSDTAVIQIDSVPQAGVLNQNVSVCEGTSKELHLTGSVADSLFWQYSSDNGATWQTIPGSDMTNYMTFPINGNVWFQVLALNGVCLPDTSNVVMITMLPTPIANAGNDTTIYQGESVTLNGSGGVTGIWIPGATLSDSTVSNPVATPAVSTEYVYYVINTQGCIGSDSVLIEVLDLVEFNIRNIITANNDNINDTWNITGVEFFPMTEVKIFNQYGKLLYENSDYKNEWKGDYKGARLPNGTYYYVVLKGGTEEEYKGTLTLLGNE